MDGDDQAFKWGSVTHGDDHLCIGVHLDQSYFDPPIESYPTDKNLYTEFHNKVKPTHIHPEYMRIRFGTAVTYNNVLYPNIEYVLSAIRQQMDTFDGEPLPKTAYSSEQCHLYLANGSCEDTIGNEPDDPADVQRLTFCNHRPSEKCATILSDVLRDLLLQVFYQHGFLWKYIMVTNGPIWIRDYYLTDSRRMNILEAVRDIQKVCSMCKPEVLEGVTLPLDISKYTNGYGSTPYKD